MNVMQHVAGFVLAGGASSRMGRAKALLEIEGVPLVVRAAKLVESVAGTVAVIGGPRGVRPAARQGEAEADTDTDEVFGLPVIEDNWPGAGPLGAIATALRASSAPWNLAVACDLPHLTREWLEYLVRRALASQADAVLPLNTRGAEPLCAMYHKRGETVIRAALEQGVRKVTDGLGGLRVETIEPAEWKAFDSNGFLFKNVNSPEDYEEARSALGAGARTRQP